ncbi:MAG: protein translocase subunit SecF [Bacteriovoracaceae bacterium]|jgi:preprotein translocase subunit SecF|nr:protein translocase subunit SecF [Bacteriovoracaceae bacterium]
MSKYNFNFVGKFPITTIFSLIFVLASIYLFASKGLNYGVDFKGGAEVQVKFGKTVNLNDLRTSLKSHNFKSSQVQSIGEASNSEYLIKVSASEKDLNKVTDKITTMLKTDFANQNPDILKTDIVGPKAGEQLRISGFQAMIWALLMIMIYIALRFDYKYSPGAIVALIHDVVIIVGIFCLLDKEFSLQIVGALLAVIGYSVNDTVVVYDRVREHEERSAGSSLKDKINKALNETLTRTILTSITTFIVAFIMFMMGGGVIHDFFFVICLGVLIGTYSSLYVAAPTILFFDKFKKN